MAVKFKRSRKRKIRKRWKGRTLAFRAAKASAFRYTTGLRGVLPESQLHEFKKYITNQDKQIVLKREAAQKTRMTVKQVAAKIMNGIKNGWGAGYTHIVFVIHETEFNCAQLPLVTDRLNKLSTQTYSFNLINVVYIKNQFYVCFKNIGLDRLVDTKLDAHLERRREVLL